MKSYLYFMRAFCTLGGASRHPKSIFDSHFNPVKPMKQAQISGETQIPWWEQLSLQNGLHSNVTFEVVYPSTFHIPL